MGINVSKVSNSNLFSQCHNKLNKIGNMTLESVSKADNETCNFLRKATPVRLKELAKMNCYAADKVKHELDLKYGENNYVLIAIGRSISSIVELIGYMGVNTKNIPLSGLRKCEIEDISSRNLLTYKTFLNQIGLSKSDLKQNSEKTYILMDYAYYGRTLDKTKQLMNSDEFMGDAKNLIALKINDILGEDYDKRQFRTLFQYNRFKDYSYVGKLHVDELKKVYERYSPDKNKEYRGNITQGLRKLFWFNVFDCLKEQNYKDIIPIKELNAIYEHNMSPRAIRNYIKRECKKTEEI